jgi:hypothetical protein
LGQATCGGEGGREERKQKGDKLDGDEPKTCN